MLYYKCNATMADFRQIFLELYFVETEGNNKSALLIVITNKK